MELSEISNFKLSVVVPCYNEEGNLEKLYSELNIHLSRFNFEVILVNDGSSDKTADLILDLAKRDTRVKYINFSRNFGHQNALRAGIQHASGDCIVSMDGDLQHPPSLIPKLIDLWLDGYDVVYTRRQDPKELSAFKRFTAKMFYNIINSMADVNIEPNTADFRLIDRKVADVFNTFDENPIFIRGIVPWLGFKQIAVDYVAQSRFAGTTKYTFKKMVRFAIAGITSFSVKPLQLATTLGLLVSAFAFLYILYVLYIYFFKQIAISGWSSMLISILLLGGIQLLVLGIMGEYLGKMYMAGKRRPNYIIRSKNI